MQKINEYFDYLYALERIEMNYTLERIRLILEHLGNPQDRIKMIHIAGTNGKGGTASFLASILMEHRLKTGLFTSPHILRFNERIRINGRVISNRVIKKFVDDNLRFFKKVKPSFFEVNTAMAFKYFADNKADVAVIETGLGGRLDSTNVIMPELSIITQIGMDHMYLLGNTLTKIAKEKLGIVKPGIDVIVSDKNKSLKPLFKKSIAKKHLLYLDDIVDLKFVKSTLPNNTFTLKNKNYHSVFNAKTFTSPLPGRYQMRNAATALIAAEIYLKKKGIKPSIDKYTKGISNVVKNSGYRGRFETIKDGDFNYIFDVSHNPDGIKESLTNLKGCKTDAIIFGMMSDKDYRKSVQEILKYSDRIIFTKPNYKRAIEANVLYNFARGRTKENELFCTNNLNGAVLLAKGLFYKGGTVLFIGSFFLISDAIKALKMQKHFT